MRILSLLLIICMCQVSFAKTKKKRTRTKSATRISKKIKKKKRRRSKSGRWTITPVAGVTVTQFKLQDMGDIDGVSTKPGVGMAGGLNISLPFFSRYMSYDTGLIYSQVNSKYQIQKDNLLTDEDYQMERLSLPLTASVFPFQKKNAYFIRLGVINHYFLGGQATATISENGNSRSETYNLERKNYQDFTADGLIATGFKFYGRRGLGILMEAQYHHAFSEFTAFDEGSITTRGFAGILGMNISF